MFINPITQQELRQYHKLNEQAKELEDLKKSIKTRLATGTDVEPGHFTAELQERWTTPASWREDALSQLIQAYEGAATIVSNVKTIAESNKSCSHILKVDYKTTRK